MKKFKWTDELVLEFAKLSTQGSYRKYKNARTLEDKLIIFQNLKQKKDLNV